MHSYRGTVESITVGAHSHSTELRGGAGHRSAKASRGEDLQIEHPVCVSGPDLLPLPPHTGPACWARRWYGIRLYHIPPHLVVRSCRRALLPSRGQDWPGEPPVGCGDAPARACHLPETRRQGAPRRRPQRVPRRPPRKQGRWTPPGGLAALPQNAGAGQGRVGLRADRAPRRPLRGCAHRLPARRRRLTPVAPALAMGFSPRGAAVVGTAAEALARPPPSAWALATARPHGGHLGAATRAPRCREAAPRVGARGARLAEPLPPARPRPQGRPTAGGAGAALGAGPPPLRGGRLRQRSAWLRPRGRRARGGPVAGAVPQGPAHAAPDQRGPLSRVRQAAPRRCSGPAVQRPRPPPPASAPLPRRWGPSAQRRRARARGERGPITAPPARLSPPGGALQASRAPAGRRRHERRPPWGKTGPAAGPAGPWRRPMGRPPRRIRPYGEGRVPRPAALPRAWWMRCKPRARRQARTKATHAVGGAQERQGGRRIAAVDGARAGVTSRGGRVSPVASPGQRPWARRRPGEGNVGNDHASCERLGASPLNAVECEEVIVLALRESQVVLTKLLTAQELSSPEPAESGDAPTRALHSWVESPRYALNAQGQCEGMSHFRGTMASDRNQRRTQGELQSEFTPDALPGFRQRREPSAPGCSARQLRGVPTALQRGRRPAASRGGRVRGAPPQCNDTPPPRAGSPPGRQTVPPARPQPAGDSAVACCAARSDTSPRVSAHAGRHIPARGGAHCIEEFSVPQGGEVVLEGRPVRAVMAWRRTPGTSAPITDATCASAFASEGRRSSRAASTAWTVSGSANREDGSPWSAIACANSSRKKGFPSPLVTIVWNSSSDTACGGSTACTSC